MTTRDHILQVPAYVLYLRFVQAGFALIILALSAFGLSVSAFDGDSLMLYAVRTLAPRFLSSTDETPSPCPA